MSNRSADAIPRLVPPRASATLMLAMSALGWAACTPAAQPLGGSDAGLAPDGWVAMTADASPDAAVPSPDAGACVFTPTDGLFGSLPAVCLPRCTASTYERIRACADQACVDAAVAADTLPSTTIRVGGMEGQIVCNDCVFLQRLHCVSAAGCGAEVDDYRYCIASGATCAAEADAAGACASRNMTAFSACADDWTMGINACFVQ